MAAADAESPPDAPVVECWACSVLVAVPEVGGAPAPMFRCGWCGAINDHTPRPASGGGAAAARRTPERGARGRARRLLRLLGPPLRWLVVAFVVVLIAAVSAVGLCVVLPRAFPNPVVYLLHAAFATLLLMATSLHFITACCHSPGRVHECVALPARAAAGHYPEGAFEGWAFCAHPSCNAPKPPGTHHCSTCGFCVVELDHHCPFINNCVGRANMRAFLLFLACICLACAYALVICSYLIWSNWALVTAGLRAATWGSSDAGRAGAAGEVGGGWTAWVMRMSVTSTMVVAVSPWWLLATYYLLAVCGAALMCVGVLLVTQLRYMATGMTYIDYLKAQQQLQGTSSVSGDHQNGGGDGYGGGGTAGGADGGSMQQQPVLLRGPGLWVRLREVLGGGSSSGGGALSWLVPQWDPPEGVLLGAPADEKKAS